MTSITSLLVASTITSILLSIFIQLSLSSLGIAPILKELPPLEPFPQNDGVFTNKLEKIGEGDLVMPECLVVEDRQLFLSLGDGRIVKGHHEDRDDGEQVLRWETLVRTGEDNANCGKGGSTDTNDTEENCGRPLGMMIVNKSSVTDEANADEEGVLLIADAYRGLLFFDFGESKLITLATRHTSDSLPFQLLNGVVQAPDGSIYFTETSRDFKRRRIFWAAFDGRPTGRLLKYTTQKGVEVVADEIYMPNGLTVSHDKEYLLVISGVQVLRYSLMTKEMETFINLQGTGDNIHASDRLPNGEPGKCYWAALGSKFAQPFSFLKSISNKPVLKSIIVALVPYKAIVNAIPKLTALAIYSEDGTLLDVYQDKEAR